MKVAKLKVETATAARPRGLFFAGLLALILAALFWKSFLPGYVHFSNDGPLGQQNAAWTQVPGAFTGAWGDLNDIGGSAGASAPDVTALMHLVLHPLGAEGPILYAKFFPVVALFILGLGAWTFFRQLKLSPLAAVLGGLAAALNSAFFSTACWGVASQQIAVAMTYFALALAVSNTPETPMLTRWVRWALAGLAVGANVMQGADIGAIFSLLIAAVVFYKVLIEDIAPLVGIERPIVLFFVNGAFLSLFVLGIVFGLGIFKLCLLFVFLLVTAFVLNWSLIRKLIPLTKTEQIVALSLVNLAFLLLFIYSILHGFGFFPLVFLLIVAVMLNWALLRYNLFVNRCGLSVIRLAVIAAFAGFIAVQTILSLVGTSISGVAGTEQNAETKARQWNWATQWSFPKAESLSLFVPGLFGYRMDTPKNMMESFQDSYKGGNYWGAVGRDVAWDRFLAGGKQGTPPDTNRQYLRFSGGGGYAGILVALIAIWAIAQSLRRQNSAFDEKQRRMLWFWTALLIGSLLLAWGRFAPFYAVLYKLPYASVFRNPTKFLLVFSWALVIIFAYGVHGLSRRYLEVPAVGSNSPLTQLTNWWTRIRGFDRRWTLVCVFALVCSILAWLIYGSQKAKLISYLQDVGFPDKGYATLVAGFSIGQAGWFIPFFALAVGLCTLVIAGVFAGKRAKLGGILLGVLLIADLGRANLPWVIHWDYQQKYASNPIIDILRDKPYEHRVAGLRSGSLFEELYQIEWKQHQFPYYNVQCLDIVQSPRVASDLEAYDMAVTSRPDRYWQLTNTRYLLGPTAYLDSLNQQLDPVQKRFSVVARFNLVPKPGVPVPEGYSPEQFVSYLPLEEVTAQPSSEGPYALFEYSGALPRAKLYSNWLLPMSDKTSVDGLTKTNLGEGGWTLLQRVGTNDFLTLNALASPAFNPSQTVLLAESPAVPNPPAMTTIENTGTVEYTSYAPKDIKFHTQAATPTVLLLNDKYDSHWRVSVDGKTAPLLRCNFIMRGVYLTGGEHTVEFYFGLPTRPLYVTLSAIVLGILLCGFLFYLEHKPQTPVKK